MATIDNILNGTDGNDPLQGTADNDWLLGKKGNDTLLGGAGFDTAIFNGELSGYKLSATEGQLVVEGEDGLDKVQGDIENLRFSNTDDSDNISVTQESIANGLTNGNQNSTTVQSFDGGFANYWLGPDGFYVRHFATDGTSVALETKILDVANDKVSQDVAVATFSDGSFVVAWTGEDADQAGLYVQRFDVNGKAVSSKFRANDTITDVQNKPAIAILSDQNSETSLHNGYVVAWQSANQGDSIIDGVAFGETPNTTGIFAQIFDSNSKPVGGELKISRSGGGNPFATALEDGQFIVGYEGITSGIDRMSIYASLYNKQGNVITPLFDPNLLSAPYKDQIDDSAYDPYDAVDDLAVSGFSTSSDSTQINYAIEPKEKTSDDSGRETENELRKTAKNPTATTLESGQTTVVVWHAPVDPYEIIPPQGKIRVDYDRSIMLRLYDNTTGEALTQEIKANTFSRYDQTQPAVAALKEGGFVVVWQSLLTDKSYLGIYGQRFDSMGQKLGSEFLINTKLADSQKEPAVTGLADGGFVVSWVAEYQDGNQQGKYQNGLSGTEVVMQRFDNEGNKQGLSLAGGAENDNVILGGDNPIQLDGAAGNDILTSGDGIDTLRGGDGDDTLNGGQGNDFLFGGDGEDKIDAGKGDDWIDGGQGSDTLHLLGSKLDYEIKKVGNRYTVQGLENAPEGVKSIDTLINIELLQFDGRTNADDDGLLSLASFGNDGGSNNNGNTNVQGIEVIDDKTNIVTDLNGTPNDDTLTGGNITGKADVLQGDKGNDLYNALGNLLVINDTGGNDTLRLSTTNVDLSQPYNYKVNKIKGLAYIENVELTGNKAFNLTGNTADNILMGNQGNNVIKGGAGNDIIAGDIGTDKLTGGDGNDVFLFQSSLSNKNIDTITDFVSGTDKIRLSSAIYKDIDPDKDGTINFISAPGIKTSEVDSVSFVVYDSKTGNLYYDQADEDGKVLPPVLFAKFTALSTDNGSSGTSNGNTSDNWYGTTSGSTTTTPVGFGSNTNTGTGTSDVPTVGVKSFPQLVITDFDVFI